MKTRASYTSAGEKGVVVQVPSLRSIFPQCSTRDSHAMHIKNSRMTTIMCVSYFKSKCPLLPISTRTELCEIYFLANQSSNIKHYYAHGLLNNIFLWCFSMMFASFLSLPRGLIQRLSSPCVSTAPSLALPLLTDSSSMRPLFAHLSYSILQPPLLGRWSALHNYSLEYFGCF